MEEQKELIIELVAFVSVIGLFTIIRWIAMISLAFAVLFGFLFVIDLLLALHTISVVEKGKDEQAIKVVRGMFKMFGIMFFLAFVTPPLAILLDKLL